MNPIFESVEEKDDYQKIAEKILYQENKTKIGIKHKEDDFLGMDRATKLKLFSDMGLNLKFALTFDIAITSFYPIVESFINNSGIDNIDNSKSTTVYLTLCALAIAFENPKATYKNLFSELRLRNVYGLLEDLTVFVEKFREIFNYIANKVENTSYDTIGMFNNSSLFVPISLTMAMLLNENEVKLETIIDAIVIDGDLKLSAATVGDSGISTKEFVSQLISQLKEFNFSKVEKNLSKSFSEIEEKVNSNIEKIKRSFNDKDLKNDLETKELDKDKGDMKILRFQQWKDENAMGNNVERIDEEK